MLDRRLSRNTDRPFAVALSGGGDSLALTLIADAWARANGRPMLILTVDHGLQAESAAWTRACAAVAERLERPFRALSWEGDKPATGLPAAARRARHARLADAARADGARVVLMGHTADDLAEAAAMRAAGSTLPDPREWSPSPVWPEGRGVFLLRPLLDARREDLRRALEARGETWIEDPANADLRFARSRARRTAPEPEARREPAPLDLAAVADERAGVIRLPRAALRDAPPDAARRVLALAAVCAGGGERTPAGVRLMRLAAAACGEAAFAATLAGARIEADAREIRAFREAGEAARGGLAPVVLPAVWDGRFELQGPGEARRLAGLARQLPPGQRAALREAPAATRGGLPAVIHDGQVTCPVLEGVPSLVGERFRAAAGLVTREPD
ncbi:MAG: tRNA lysidine(34) synthetase TilS [Phenylobacterium sp.]|uniref:tRNA lysidine(34) synthetase TilS n=1 Tax=Phenylobacterium sp. TaxID=1871053 RepID=UPI001A59C992|nr:tRNA lysidine(34) synthetase TilS [Phenylobacterium sp.]MBL8771635.1 tRNA lysidine(34) synthetase TilS [Phenylobacterium sp.]